jgi:hypothetical protein
MRGTIVLASILSMVGPPIGGRNSGKSLRLHSLADAYVHYQIWSASKLRRLR